MKTLTFLFAFFSITAYSQRNVPKMAGIFAEGYYVSLRGDTIKGEIRTNPQDLTSFYHEFAFRAPNSKKARVFNSKRAKAYGFDGRHFENLALDEKKLFMERLAQGRLAVYEFRFHGKVNGTPAVETAFYVRDTWESAKITELSRINKRFYKRSLKPFIGEEQPEIWERIDKFNFSRRNMLNAVNEFNSSYRKMGN